METASMANRWVDSYLSALLGAGLSTEHFKAAAEQKEVAEDDADANIAAKYYVNQILNLDEESIQQAWLKVSHKSNVRMADNQDARLQYLSWRVWGMKRKHATVELERAVGDLDLDDSDISDTRSEELTSPVIADAEEVANLVRSGPTLALPRLAVQPSAAATEKAAAAAAAAAVADLEVYGDSDLNDNPFSPTAPGSPSAGEIAFHSTLTAERVPKLYCVLISMHGLVRGDAMELGKDPDTGGQVKYVVELAKALSRHPAVHRVDLLTRLIRDPKVAASYGELEEALTEPEGEMGGAYICRIKCGPVDNYLRKEQLWPYIREFADNALTHVCKTLTKLSNCGEPCELYDIHGHYADAGEAAALMSYTLGVDMVLTGHSLGRNKLDHLLKSGTMSRAEIEEGYKVSRRIEAEERALDAALLVFTSTHQEVKDQWGLYDGYNADLERVVRQRVRRGRHFPIMRVIPPGLDFSNLKISPPPDPLEAPHNSTGACGGPLKPVSSFGNLRVKMRRRSSAGSQWAHALGLCHLNGDPKDPSQLQREGSGSGMSSPLHHDSQELVPLMNGGDGSVGGASPKGSPKTPATPAAADTFTRPVMPEDPPIWRSIFKFLRNPRKPVILAMSRPDAKKNITTLVKAYGKNKALREIANLVLIMGNREVIDSMAPGSAKVMDQVLKLIDAFDLYGSVAYPKRHTQDDISDIYLLPAATRGVFVNIALQEPFGLTLIEAAAHGVPIVATTNGGPVDIVHTLSNGILVDPTNDEKVAEALLELLTNSATWDKYSANGVTNINAYSWSSHCMKCLSAVEWEKANFCKRDKNAQLRSNFSASLDDFSFNRFSGSFSDHRAASMDPSGALLSPRSTATLVGQSFTTDDINFASSSDINPAGLGLKVASSSSGGGSGGSPHHQAGERSSDAGGVLSPKSGGGRAAERSLAASSVPLTGVYGGDASGGLNAPASAFSGPAAEQFTMVRDKYMVFILDSSDAIDRLSKLLARKGKIVTGLAKAGHSVGLAVASAFSLTDTNELLKSKGIAMSDLDFAVTSCGAEVWYCGDAAAVGAASAVSSGTRKASDNCVLDETYDLKLDLNWDALSVRRVLSQCMGQLLRQLPGVAASSLAKSSVSSSLSRRASLSLALPRYKIQVEPAGAAHHLLVTLDPQEGGGSGFSMPSAAAGAPAGDDSAAAADNSKQQAPPVLSAQDVETLITRIKRRLRRSGLRTQIMAQMDAGRIKLHLTPLRGSRALALRHLTYSHKVDMSSLVLVCCAKDVQPSGKNPTGIAKFACSDMEELVSGVQGVLVMPPPPSAAAADSSSRRPDGFAVDLDLYTHDARLQLLPASM